MSPSKQMASIAIFLFILFSLVIPMTAIPLRKSRPLNLLRRINRDGPYLGLITVYPPEEEAFFATNAFKPNPRHPFVDLSGRRFRVGKMNDKRVIYVRCGVGMVNAAATTQQMFDLFYINGIVHFGIAGNANNSMSIGDVTIPKEFAHTGIWDWLKPNGTLPSNDIAHLDIGSYNEPKEEGINLLGRIGYSNEQLFSSLSKPNVAEEVFWVQTNRDWVKLATNLEGMELEKCVNLSICLPEKPKLIVGLRGSTSNIFVDNQAYRKFLFDTFHVSSVDMESSAIVMVGLSNGCHVIVLRGLSDLAGGQKGNNGIFTFGSLAALNVAKAVVQFVKILPKHAKRG
ncbi:bark storage protein A-like [Impatiens glandulifera]|uniref:bark storage protein A-like n=1 Tax=Impatiens glandulifera TaxID=253017 RepID=UPI001FB1311A|nr:bark storage protein A-like [Impatiens glandulifera]